MKKTQNRFKTGSGALRSEAKHGCSQELCRAIFNGALAVGFLVCGSQAVVENAERTEAFVSF